MTTDTAKKVAARFARTAAVTLDEATFKEIAELTDINAHTEANILGAKALKATKLVKKLELVLKLQDLEGHTPAGLNDYRYGLHKELQATAKRVLSPEDALRFIGSY